MIGKRWRSQWASGGIRQANDDSVKTAKWAEVDPHVSIRTIDGSGAIGRYAHQALGAGQGAVKAMAGLLDLGTNPFVSPAHKIGGKHG